ncbi:MAG: hypothetical protein IPK63_02050 [Candidatus Competibacteraceae bacterium]|nr:hypothetical protein [Candidatus Competibacteraceae bacterium]
MVDRDMTGMGMGPMLMRYMIEYARKLGIKGCMVKYCAKMNRCYGSIARSTLNSRLHRMILA